MHTSIASIAPAFCSVTSQKTEQCFDVATVRAHFPILQANPEIAFFDNAATTHKPTKVLEEIEKFNSASCSNAGRSSYSWSTKLSKQIEESRSEIASFLNTDPNLVAFTAGATDSLNLVTMSWALHNLQNGDEIMLCREDHQSAVLPWYNLQKILERFGIAVKVVPFRIHPSGTYDRKSIAEAIGARTRLISLSHIHHVYGMEMDMNELRALIPRSVMISLDASQSVGHIGVDATQLNVDFISFSGHKMFASNGIGVLWSSSRALKELWTARIGAKSKVENRDSGLTLDRSTLANVIECGTLNLPGILSMRAAARFLKSMRSSGAEQHVSALTKYLVERLKGLPGLNFAPGIGVCDCTRGFGIVSFSIDGLRSGDLGDFLDSQNIFVRTGDHCQAKHEPEQSDYVRISLQIYNTFEEVNRVAEAIADACN